MIIPFFHCEQILSTIMYGINIIHLAKKNSKRKCNSKKCLGAGKSNC